MQGPVGVNKHFINQIESIPPTPTADQAGVPRKEIEALMGLLDLDGDQRIDYDEFVTAAVSHSLLQKVILARLCGLGIVYYIC